MMSLSGCPHIDFTAEETWESFYDFLRDLQHDAPVVWTEAHGGYWVVTRYADVLAVLQDWENFTSEEGVSVPVVQSPLRALPMESDPPIQLAYRRVINPFLTRVRVEEWEGEIRSIVRARIATFLHAGSCDVVRAFAQTVPSTVLMRFVLDADEADIEQCTQWVTDFALQPGGNEAIEGMTQLMQYCYRLASAKKLGESDGSLMDCIVRSEIMGRPIEDMESLGLIALLIIGGFDTSVNAISSAVVALAEQPELQERLRNDPSLLVQATEEFLRFDPPVIGLGRRARRDVVLAGQTIRAGELVYASLAGANRDAGEFPDPGRLDVDRFSNRHLTFGAGPHRCVGSHLGRLIIRIALEELLGHLGEIRLVEPVEIHQALVRGPKRAVISFTPLKELP